MAESSAQKRFDNLPVNRKVVQQISIAGDEAIDGCVKKFKETDSAFGNLPDGVRNDLSTKAGVLEEIMQRAFKQATSIPKKSRPKKWAEPIANDKAALVTFGDLKRRLKESTEIVCDEVDRTEGMYKDTSKAVEPIYQRALLQVEITLSRLQDPQGEAARRVRAAPPTDGKNIR